MTDRLPGFATLAVHAGAQPDPTTGARVTPIYQTTSFVFNDADHAASLFGLQAFGNIYTRIGNPTQAVLEERVAALEGGTAAVAVASGHAAQVVVLQQLLRPGDEFIAARKLYGGSINQFTHAFKSFGWNVAWADPDDIASFERLFDLSQGKACSPFQVSGGFLSGQGGDEPVGQAFHVPRHQAGPPFAVEVAEVVIRLTKHATPCVTIAGSFSGGHFERLSSKLHPSDARVYASVEQEGTIRPDDEVRVLDD